MMPTHEADALELMVDRATEGLSPQRQVELDGLLAARPELDPEAFELAAAAVELAYTTADEPLPAELRQRLSRQASAHFAAAASRPVRAPRGSFARPGARRPGSDPSPSDATRWLGWLAAAAALTFAIISQLSTARLEPTRSPDVEQPRSAAAARQAMIARGAEVIRLDWQATDDPAARAASGDVVWSAVEQSGYMRFEGLSVNDPLTAQYQLWIFDGERDERYPVDGGVFDISADGETVVPIGAKLRIHRPTLFAVTVEQPGGVVVSSRERLALAAPVS